VSTKLTIGCGNALSVALLSHDEEEGQTDQHDNQHKHVHHDVEARVVLRHFHQTCAQNAHVARFQQAIT